MLGFGIWALGFGFWALGLGFRGLGFGFRVGRARTDQASFDGSFAGSTRVTQYCSFTSRVLERGKVR